MKRKDLEEKLAQFETSLENEELKRNNARLQSQNETLLEKQRREGDKLGKIIESRQRDSSSYDILVDGIVDPIESVVSELWSIFGNGYLLSGIVVASLALGVGYYTSGNTTDDKNQRVIVSNIHAYSNHLNDNNVDGLKDYIICKEKSLPNDLFYNQFKNFTEENLHSENKVKITSGDNAVKILDSSGDNYSVRAIFEVDDVKGNRIDYVVVNTNVKCKDGCMFIIESDKCPEYSIKK